MWGRPSSQGPPRDFPLCTFMGRLGGNGLGIWRRGAGGRGRPVGSGQAALAGHAGFHPASGGRITLADQPAPACGLSVGAGAGPLWETGFWGGDPTRRKSPVGPAGQGLTGVQLAPLSPSLSRDRHRHMEFSQKVIQQALDRIPKFAYKDLYL